MDHFERIQKVIDYIEDNLKEKITLEDLAKISLFSAFHFHRVFQAIAGEPVMEYIRKRRLSNAVYELINTDRRITDIAYDYLFNSHDTFTRAFKRLYGISPDEYRKNGTKITMFEKKDLRVQKELNRITRSDLIEPRIVLMNDFMVVGLESFVSREEFINTVEGNVENRAADNVAEKFFLDLKREVPNQVNFDIEICYNYDCHDGYMNMVCVEVNSLKTIPKGMVGKVVPGNKYAVFSHKFNLSPDKITVKKLEDKICKFAFGTWFPYSTYDPADSYTFELYDISRINEGITRVDFYIPIVSK